MRHPGLGPWGHCLSLKNGHGLSSSNRLAIGDQTLKSWMSVCLCVSVFIFLLLSLRVQAHWIQPVPCALWRQEGSGLWGTFAGEQRPLRVIQTQKGGCPLPLGSPYKSSTAPGSPSSRAKLHRRWVCIFFNKDSGFLSTFPGRILHTKPLDPLTTLPPLSAEISMDFVA